MRRLRSLIFVATLALAAVLAAPAAASATYDESTAVQITPGHTGFAAGGSLDRPPLQTRWTRSLGTSTSFPLVAAGRVFVVAYDPKHSGGMLHALDAVTGATLWMRAVPGGGQITYDAGRVFVAERAGTVVAVDAATGATRWTRNLPEPFQLQIPVAADGTVYVDSAWSGGALYALDASDGSTRWLGQFYNGGGPAVDGSFVYVSDDYQGQTGAFSRADGTRAWSGTKECFVGSGRAVADGARVIGPYNGGCGAVVDAASGRSLDTFSSASAAAVAGDVAVARNGFMLQARSLATGVLAWEFEGDGKLNSAPVIVNETVYAGSATGMLFAVDLRTGAPLWSGSIATGASAGAAGMAAGGGLLVVPAGGTITALESVQAARPGLDLRITSGPDGPISASSARLTFGSTSPLALQVCRLDGSRWLPCLGSVSYDGLADGPHMFEVQTRDVEGSVIALAVRGWSVDTAAPVASITRGPSGLTTASWASFGVTSDDADAQLECRLDDGAWSMCGRSPYNTVEYANLADGPHRFDVRARDALGNVQAGVTSRAWTVDTTAPRVQFDAGPQGATTQTSATFAFSADEAASFLCSMDGAPFAACSSPVAMSGVGAGTHSFAVKARDAAGNLSSPAAQRTWTVSDPPADTPPTDPLPAPTQAPPPPPPAPPRAAAARAPALPTPQITIGTSRWARMLAADAVTLLRSSNRAKLRRGAKLRLYAFRPGRAAAKITMRRGGRTITVARAEARFASAGVRTVRLRLTAAGRRALKGQRRLSLRVRVTVTPKHARPVAATRTARV